ncbi:MAG: Hsp20/alpha crystallin family protein [Flavisolibacter sp.]
MTNYIMYSDNVSVYPGIYERPLSEKELEEELNKTGVEVKAPHAHMQQFHDYYRIEMAVPGYNKESLFIHIKDHVLSIAGLNKKQPGKTMADNSEDNAHSECFIRNIILPGNADTDFVTAEYNNGILHIYLSTSNQPCKNGSREIIVY